MKGTGDCYEAAATVLIEAMARRTSTNWSCAMGR